MTGGMQGNHNSKVTNIRLTFKVILLPSREISIEENPENAYLFRTLKQGVAVPEPMQINIELSPEQAEGIYANLVLITHSPAEFVMDFTRVLPGTPKTRVYARIIMAPQHVKGLYLALKEDIEKYEKEFGEIRAQKQDVPKTFGFSSTPTQTDKKS